MAYQAKRNHNNENQSDSSSQSWLEKKQDQKAQNRENTKELAKDAGTVALQGLGVPGPLAGMAANKIAQNPLVNKTLNKTSDKLHKNPVASKAINTVAQSPAKDAAMGAIGSKASGAAASKEDTNHGSETGGKTSALGKPSLGKSSPFAKKSNLDSDQSEERGKAKTSMEGIRNMATAIKKIPPFVWPILGWGVLIFLLIMIILAVISQFLPMFGMSTATGTGGSDTEYVVKDPNSPEGKFYTAVSNVQKEYKDQGKNFDAGLISGVYYMMNHYDSSFTFEDMTESEIRNIADLMFQKSIIIITCEKENEDDVIIEGTLDAQPSCPEYFQKNSDKTVTQYIYDESSFKSELANYARDHLSLKDDRDADKFAEEVFQYVSSFKSFTERKTTGNLTGNGSYWWPIGSTETTNAGGHLFATGTPAALTITSTFGPRTNPTTGVYQEAHGAIDIAGGMISTQGAGSVAVIASKDGIVERVTTNCLTHLQSGADSCGGGYGNFVILKHSDGNYTLYAHMHQDTITVSVGDSVAQGQVIGRVGSSGNSTGPHLHFEVRVGENTSTARQDPLNFVNPESPRPSSASSSLVEMLHSFEGTGPTPVDNHYIVYADSGGVLTVGYGVTLTNNASRFQAFGVDVSTLQEGSKVAINIVDAVETQIINDKRDSILSLLSRNAITLESYQIDALICRMYNVGNISSFPENYKKYGNTQELYDNYMSRPITDTKGNVLTGLQKRRLAEWNLFHTGIYQGNS